MGAKSHLTTLRVLLADDHAMVRRGLRAVVDGCQTMKAIRKQAKFKSLLLLALPAKATNGDREECIEAGANDYLAKPVDSDRLLSLSRMWLFRGAQILDLRSLPPARLNRK